MQLSELYDKIPYDLAGSRSKNRFRQELLWGVSEMFNLWDQDDFCVIFDYKCDIEIHRTESLEFYQIKSHKVQRPYSFNKLKEKTGENSIIAKLFLLQNVQSPDIPIKCAVVSNAFFKIGKKVISDVEQFAFTDLDPKDQNAIKAALKSELQIENIDLANMYYIYTSMDLCAPDALLTGKIVRAFERIKGCEPVKPNALYRLIVDTAEQKACYELRVDNYEELVKTKGITKAELENMLDRYMENADNSVEQVKSHIEQAHYGSGKKRKLNQALARIIEFEQTSYDLQTKQAEILEQLDSSDPNLSFEELTQSIYDNLSKTFPIEYTDEEKIVLIWIIAKRWESGKYA